MKVTTVLNSSCLLIAATSVGMLSGCANYEVNSKRGDIPGHYIRYELQEADRAVEAARQAGKDQSCPAEFKAAEDAKNNAYDVFRACHTEEGAALAKQATAKANALCPPKAVVAAPAAPAPAPSDILTIAPSSIAKGQTAILTWSSKNASKCTIQPNVGPVEPQGSIVIKPADNTTYTLTCSGEGDTAATSAANISVNAPVPVPVPVVIAPPVAAPAAKLCSPTVIDIQFDTNKSDIKPQFHAELKKLGDFLKEFPDAKGVIEGHTDSVGDKASNIKLSQRRADSVRNYLVKSFGIAPERISSKGFGPTKPVADNKTAEGKLKNRRVEANFSCSGK